ncbi:pentatricopeptide repeat-containing protein At1g30610, chloroplastic isoform X2 [Durio zibethinus]|uniref:Pentatricopeptide repeat-containing protein At1g30610, chloroplastic isoform X2 n=1 Tax=Durio zibethinus TaxID=66656 RepID=A0A6P5YST5_DURZI|nr:pentatricopeptide repeat-containing protein At1g30610, chloroplastic isoform X2 [Durio zibethinus]
MTMGSVQMCIFSFERNGIYTSVYSQKPFSPSGFMNCWRPTCGVALWSKNSSNMKRRFALRVVNSGGGVLEKEFEFKPSFDEYLKTMESVREKKQSMESVREKKQSFDSNRGNSSERLNRGKLKDDSKEKQSMESVREKNQSFKSNRGNSSERLNRGKSKDDSKRNFGEEKKMSKIVEHNEVKMKSKGATRTRSQKALLLKGEDADLKVKERDEYKNFEEPSDEVDKPQVSRMGIEERRKRDKYDSKFKSDKENVKLVKFGEFPEEVKMSKMGKYNEVNTNFEGVRRNRSRKAFLEEDKDKDLKIERAAFKNFEQSNDIVDKPPISKMEMEERVLKLAKSLNGADIDMPEWMFSKMMQSAKIKFTDYWILRVIQILGKLGNWRMVLQVIEWLEKRERFKSHKLRHIYTAALNALGKARRPVEALNIFHSMQQQMASYPDIVAYHSIAVTLGQAGHLRELFDVIDSMGSPPKKKFKTGPLGKWDPRLEPDIVVYNAVLNACARRKEWEGAFWVLQQLKQQHLQPSTSTYGLVMEVMFECGKYNLVHEFFRKIEKSSIPNALTYRVLVNTLWKEGKIHEAVLAVQGMEKRGIVGSAALYYDLARCLCSAGRCQEALMQIEKICKVANKPLVVTYTGLIQACLDSGNIQNGAYIFNQMQNFCSPNLVTCNIMLKAYLDHGLFDQAKDLFQKISEDANQANSKSDYLHRVIPDIYTFNIMLDACIQHRRWDEFEHVYGRMLHHGFHFNAKRHLRMILDAARGGKKELLETTWEHMARIGRTPPLPLIKERFCMKLEKNDYVSAVSCIIIHPSSELQGFSESAWFNLFKNNASRFQQEMIVGLVDEVEKILGRTDSPNPVLRNLLTSSKEFLSTHLISADINLTETVCTVECSNNFLKS